MCEAVSNTRELENKAALRFCLTPIRMVIVSKNTPSPANSSEEVGKKKLLHTASGNINTGASVEISMPFLKTLKINPLYDSALLLSGIY